MKHAVINAQGFPTAYYDDEIHGDAIPAGAVEITEDQWQELIDNPRQRRLVDGKVVVFDPPPPVPTIDDYRRAIQAHVDATAGQKGYDTGASCASYAGSTNEAWSEEALAFIAWRDAVWAHAYAELGKVQSGERDQPAVADMVAELPAMIWPA